MKDASVFLPSWDCSPVSFSFAKRSPWLFSAEGWIATTTGDLLSLLTELKQALTSFLIVLAAQIFVWLDLPTSLFLNRYFQHLSIKCSPIKRPFFLSPVAGSITSPSSSSEKIFCVSLGWETAETWPYQNVFVLLKEECIYLSKSLIQVHSLAGRNSEQGEGASVNPCFTNKAAEPQKIFGLAQSQTQNMKMRLFLLITDSELPSPCPRPRCPSPSATKGPEVLPPLFPCLQENHLFRVPWRGGWDSAPFLLPLQSWTPTRLCESSRWLKVLMRLLTPLQHPVCHYYFMR